MSENLSSVGKVINTVVRIATTGGILWTQFGCTSTVSAPSAEPEPTTKPTTNVPTAYDAGSEYENKVAQAIRDGGDPCVDPSSILFDAGTPNMTTDDGILTICTNPTTGKDSIYNQPAGSYKVSKLDIAVDPSARTITGSVIEETETKPTETPQSSNPNDIPDNVPQSQLKLIFQADITKEQIVYSPTGEVGDAIIYNVTPSFRPDYERFTKNAGFIESPALQPSATLEPTATVAPTETPNPTATPEVTRVEDFFGAGPAEIRHISKSEDLTQKYLVDPGLITDTVKFTNGILDAGTRGSVLKFNATLVSYQIDNFTLTDPNDPNIPVTGEVLTTRYAIKNTDGSISVFEVRSFGGMFVEDSYNSILEQEDKLEVGKEYIFGLQYNPSTTSSYNREKFIKETQNKVKGSPVEKIIDISLHFSAPKVAITESGLIKIITSSPNTVTKLDNEYGTPGLYSN